MRIQPNQPYAATLSQQTSSPASPVAETSSSDRIQEMLTQLKECYSFVHFETTSLTDLSEIEEYALLSGSGLHMVISPEFLSFMQQSEENAQKGMSILQQALQKLTKLGFSSLWSNGTGAVVQEDGKVSFWSTQKAEKEQQANRLLEQLENLRQLQKSNTMKNNLPKRKVNYSPSSISNRITASNTVFGVRSAMSQAYGSLIQLENCKNDSRYDKAAVSRAIAHAKNAIATASMKIKNLEKEELMRKQIQKAAVEKQRRKEERLKYQFEKKRKGNRSHEFAMLRKSTLLYYDPTAQDEAELYPELPGSGSMDFSGVMDVSQMAQLDSMMAAAGAITTDSGVTITPGQEMPVSSQ